MLEILNRYAHGLSSIPILHALRERGCLARLAGTAPVSAEELAHEFSANRGYLDVALRMMHCLEWLRPVADGRYEATPDLASASLIPDRIMDLYRFPFDRYVEGGSGESLEPWLELSERRWNSEHPFLPDYLDGLLIIPLLLALRAQQRLTIEGEILRLDVDPAVRSGVERLFVVRRWASRSGDAVHVNRAGRFVIDRIFVTATLASYMPMFGRAQELLFGDAGSVFERDEAGHETHVDRTVNVIGSGFQHEKFFTALTDLIIRSFDDEDYASQPKYIADMGCGDGTLLLRLYEAVRDRTRRGKVLDVHPVIPVAVDFNEEALVEASRTLAGIEHMAVHGDIGDPAALVDTLRANGVEDLHRVLHVRSFLDHNRPYKQPEDRRAAERRPQTGGNVYIDSAGQLIPLGDMVQSTVEHLRRWAQVVNEHGLVLLEVHCLTPEVTARNRDESENFHFDVYHALSHQFLLDAQSFLSCAAEAGLFWRQGGGAGFPKHLPYKRISLNHFERRPYLVRRALRDDLPALAQLPEVWPQRQARNDANEGEFLLEIEGRVVASVRCDDREGTVRITSAHARAGAASHLIDLLQFVEEYWGLSDVGHVAGIDECRSALPSTDEETSVARAVARDVQARIARYPFAVENDPRAAERELGEFSFRWLLAKLQQAGVMREAGESYELDELVRRLGVTPKYHRYFDALIRRLQDEGLVTVHGRRVETTPLVRDYALAPVEEQVAAFKQHFQQRYPAHVGLLNLTVRGLDRFEEIISGRVDITDVVFQDANMDVFMEIFRGGAVSDYFNRIVADAVHDTVVRLQSTTPKVRIIEVGAGTGATTAAVLEALRPVSGSVEFFFSDISQSFIRNAKRRFAQDYPSIEYRLLNIEEDPSRQGFEAHSFDIVVAGNVVHDTRSVDLALKQVHRLLKPGGILVMDEYTSLKDCLFFSGALLHGYWLFQDPEKRLRDSCLLGVAQWISALERTGFAVAGAHPLPTQSLDAACVQSVMLCEALAMDDAEALPPQGKNATAEVIAALIEQQALVLLGEERAAAYSGQRPVMDMGLDSLELVELKSLIERHLGVKLTPMFLFEHETPLKMASALSEMALDHQLPGLTAPASTGAAPALAGTQELRASDPVAEQTHRSADPRKTKIVGTLVEQQVFALLGQERASAYSEQRPVMDMGLDSLELVELKSLLERGLGVKLTPMFLFEHETPEKLTAALSGMVPDQQLEPLLPAAPVDGAGNAGRPAAVEITEVAAPARKDEDAIAIVGVACRFPGGAVSPDKFWKLMESGRHGIVPMPAGRWRWPSFIDIGGKHKGIDMAGFLERIDEFDAPFFRTSPKEANLMDPQQRLLLELSWEAMEDGGHRPSEFSGRKIGVFVGVCHYDYREVMATAADPVDAYVGTGSALSLLANRLSYFYDLKGPSHTVDTACSSSLFALHHAVAAIRSGDCEQALVGAANLLCSPTNSIAYYRAGMLSPTGSCRTFDQAADGYVRGEGGAMLLLKPLAMALADGDAIYGLVKGTAVNHGGQAASLTAPKPEAQAAVIEAAWQTADLALESIGYIEAHGTGTRLGDPVEIYGLIEGFARLYRARGEAWPGKRQCGLGTVKTNVGHLEGAAGLAGLIKVLLAIQHRSIPGTLNLERLNPDIDLSGSPFHVVGQNEAWPAGRDGEGRELPRSAGVSSFGFGGSNAHVVIEEYPSSRNEAAAESGQYLVPLSARNEERLAEQSKRLLEFLISAISGGDPTSAPRLADLAYTLQVGRDAMEERVAFVVRSREELMAALHTCVTGDGTSSNCYRGQAEPRRSRAGMPDERRPEIEAGIATKDLAKLASLWVNGAELDWPLLSGAGRPRRIHVPTYPFAKERYWIETAASEAGAPAGRTSSYSTTGFIHPLMHPFLHANSSNLSQQSYSATFSGDEFFLSDHQVRGEGRTVQKVLPGVAYLEMARAAIEAALPPRAESTVLELRNTVWVQPVVVTGKKQVSIALLANENDHIDFEFYSQDAEHEIAHCQGQAFLSHQPVPAALDIEQLEREMGQDRLEPVGVYAAFARKGLVYGPSFQGITAIHQGSHQVLARLRLPKTVDDTSGDYVLHPTLMDSALQAAVVLLDVDTESYEPRLPFVLESLRIVAPCSRTMIAWVRYAPGSQAGDNVTKLDIDLCDERGNISAEMRGLSLRAPKKETPPAAVRIGASECLLATPVWQTSGVQGTGADYAQHHVILCELSKVDAEKLQSLIPQSECLSLQARPQKTIAQRYTEYALACFDRIRSILQGKPRGNVLLQVVVADHQEKVLFAGLSGLLKTAALENPQLVGQVVLAGHKTTAEELAPRLREERAHGLDPLVKYENGSRQVLRWQEVSYEAEQPRVEFKDHGVYLITGGLGGLGVLFAKEILEHTRHAKVVLTGRSALSSEKQAVLDELSPPAGRLSYRQVDVGELDQVRRLITAIRDEYGQLNGILHSAGMIADDFILKKDSAQFTEVLAPKVTGTYNLDQASHNVELDFFVLFSSMAGALGNIGQGDYAAANGFMDHFAAYRNRQVAVGQRYGRTRSVDWPLWQAGRMSIDPASRERLEKAIGMQPMQTATGMHAFHRCLALPYDQILVMTGDMAPMRRALLGVPTLRTEPQPEQAAGGFEDKAFAEKTQRYLRKTLSGVLKLPTHKIDLQAALSEYGIDSILAMQLINELEETFGALSKTLFFEYQTIRELAEYFGAHHSRRLKALFAATTHRTSEPSPDAGPARASRAPAPRRRFIHGRNAAPDRSTESGPIAIIGLSGRYPEAVDIDAYWNNLREGKDCIVEVPKERWDWQEYFDDDRSRSGRHYSKWGGFIAGVDEFDPLFFNISPREAQYIDPQERLFLQHAWIAVEDAGYSRAGLQVPYERDLPGQVGVYVGVMWSEYQLFGIDANVAERRMGFAGNVASIANRVSYVLNLHGPSVALDTMCSSSLSAIHFACQDLKLGRTSMAIAGGVNVSVHPNKYLVLSVGQFISSDGHCQSFGEGGDGYIPGEGVGAVVLKRLSDAERDGDHIYGVIRGSALNHGGRTNGYTVPNPQAQAGVISRALTESQIDARHVSYIEAHGTGTKLGDPIEIAALNKAFSAQDARSCSIGSAKSNIGHCEAAAGIAGLTKVLLQMQHQQIVPSLHSTQLNPYIDFDSSPFAVNQVLRPWEPPVIDGRTLPRIAGLSSFGAGGSNAHMIVEEYQASVPQTAAVGDVAIVLSARTPEQLQQKVRDLLDFVHTRRTTIELASMAYTLQVGREPMEERVGFVVSSIEQLVEKLQAYAAGEQAIEDAYHGQVKRNKEALAVFSADPDLQQTVDKWIANGKLSRLLDLWVKGLELDWRKLYGEVKPQRISLPAYPFARERYWIDTAPGKPSAGPATAVLHPLLHSNTSDLTAQSYRSTFTGDELFITEHAGQKVLPAVACLEMVRAAIEHAAPARPESTVLKLHDTVWAPPIITSESRPVSIALFPEDKGQIGYEIYSRDAEQEIIHCQGRAVWSSEAAPPRVDIEALKRQGQRVVELSAPGAVGDYILHPTMLDGAVRAVNGSSESPSLLALDLLRIVSPCSPDMVAWVRSAPGGGAADIDLCDVRGNVAVEMRGVSWQQASAGDGDRVTEQPPFPAAAPILAHREIAFLAAAPVERKKRGVLALAAPGANASAGSSAGRPKITLSTAAAGETAPPAVSPVRLYDRDGGIFSIEIASSRSNDVIAHFLQALEWLQQEASLKVLMLSGIEHCFTSGGREEYNEAVDRKLFQRLAGFPYPVIAALQGDVIGAGFLAAALCDFMVCNEDGHYGYADAEQHHLYPTTAEAALFSERFGAARADHFLYRSTQSTGRQLQAEGWTCPILPWTQVEVHAQQLASTLAAKSQEALRLLKGHLTRSLAGLVGALTRVDVAETAAEDPSTEIAVIEYGRAGVRNEITDLSRYKAIVLVGEDPGIPDDVVFDLRRLIFESEVPVVAALPGDAKGNSWLIAQFCDDCVYSETGVYSSESIGSAFAQTAVALFAHRFGEAANEILLTGADYSGTELQRRVGALSVMEGDQVLSAARQVAAAWAKLPAATLAARKNHTATTLQDKIRSLPAAAASEQKDEAAVAAPTAISLHSRVITATAHPDGIVVVKMEDREVKNMFSEALMEGIREVFAHIAQTPAYKVVILTGYDNYFASGGTKESLLSIQEGRSKFTDAGIFHLAVECRLPVIAAMQGHGIGAGWSMGMFADIVLLSDESRYVSPYMNYGFTPGAGATYSLTDKLGPDLARESLLTGHQYTGRELRERGLTLRVLPRAEVNAAAMALAKQVARASRDRLTDLKQQLTAHVHQPLSEIFERELAMHEKTFVGRSDTLAQIESNFYQDVETPSVAPRQAPVKPPKPSVAGDALSSIVATLKTLLASELFLQERDVDENTQFIDLGLDSITGVTWIRKINDKYQTSIEATKVYSYPTLAELSRYVRDEAEKAGTLPSPSSSSSPIPPPAAPQPEALIVRRTTSQLLQSRRSRTAARFVSSTPAAQSSGPIAVIGMAGQFPKARNLEEFWQNIAEGKNCITQVDRWDLNTYYQPGEAVAGKTNSQWMGALDEYDLFDPLFFNISPTEAESMDPQQRLFLQACWHSIENAGYDARRLSGSMCGVFVGCSSTDYHQLSREHLLSAKGFTGSAMSILAARISYFLNLRGPSISIDTACSSSLVALANACDSLNSGGSDLALAGGVYVMGGSEMHIKTAQAGMLSPEGRCFTFDQRADGFVPGEGVGVVLLKRLADAQRDGDIIHGVIQGWGVNQDGKTNGITAPNPESQTRLERDVYEKYQIDPAEIQLIEAHGTGTKLGDPIEVEGLKQAFGTYTQKKDYCALGSVKSNIGHCLTAAGIAGLLKLVLALKHRQLPPTINFERLNEHIHLKDSPFYVNSSLQEWELNGAAKRQAALSSFGFSGTNAHVIVGEYLPPSQVRRPVSVKSIVPLSARTAEQLGQKARDLLDFIRTDAGSTNLADIAYTLQVGRAPMDERLGFVASSVEQLAEKLQAWLDGRHDVEDAHRGQVRHNKESISIISQDDDMKDAIVDKLIAQQKLSTMLNLWAKGLELDWNKLYGESKPRRVVLPVYPFAKERYWIDTAAGVPVAAAGGIHPLLHRNTSDLSEQRYSSRFTGDEAFLRDHRVRTDGRSVQKVLPGVAYLEMVQAAIRHAWPMQLESHLLELHDTVWLKPVVVERPEEVSIALFATDGDRVDYEIYSAQDGQLTVHCQGQAAFGDKSAPARLDPAQLRRQMSQGKLEASDVYAMFATMGLHYGRAHQGITAIHLGDKQLLAELRLPAVVEASRHEYVLHPSLMDSALQASIGLIVDPNHVPDKPSVPFALESTRIVSACTKEMVAWVRYSEGSKPGDVKLDIDLCDDQGNVCVQMRGFALRVVGAVNPGDPTTPVSSFDGDFYERLLTDIVAGQVSVDEAVKLG